MRLHKELEKAEKLSLIVLRTTKTIQKEDIESDPAWRSMAESYVECRDSSWLVKAVVSFTNSIINQRRRVFILTRDSLRNLLKTDDNWEQKIGLKNENYKRFLYSIFQGIVEQVETSKSLRTGRDVMVLRVIHPEILSFLNVDENIQMKEVRKFIDQDFVNGVAVDKEDKYNVWILAKVNNPEEWDISENLVKSNKKSDHDKGMALKNKLFQKELNAFIASKGKVKNGNSKTFYQGH